MEPGGSKLDHPVEIWTEGLRRRSGRHEKNGDCSHAYVPDDSQHREPFLDAPPLVASRVRGLPYRWGVTWAVNEGKVPSMKSVRLPPSSYSLMVPSATGGCISKVAWPFRIVTVPQEVFTPQPATSFPSGVMVR